MNARPSLRGRGAPLARPEAQLARLHAVAVQGGDFDDRLAGAGLGPLRRGPLRILQVNLGKLCNMSCRHCHVDAGPDRVDAMMPDAVVESVIARMADLPVHTVDLTGGAPELHPRFADLVDAAVALGHHVIDRCNLSVLLLARHAHLPAWLGERGVEVVASLPHPRARNTDAQRGDGAFARSIEGLRRLNAAGYGQGDPRRRLTLMHNPAGAFLPAGQAALERSYRDTLAREQGVHFDRLITLTNMPISRFLEWLDDSGNTQPYLQKLADAFNPAAVPGLMCRDTLSVGWDGQLYDCDFNQMLELPALGGARRVDDLRAADLDAAPIRTARHCLGCTAGAGSSCGGATS